MFLRAVMVIGTSWDNSSMECSNGPTRRCSQCHPRQCGVSNERHPHLLPRSFQRHLQVHSNVTLAARNLTLTPEWAEFSSGEGKVLKSGRWPGPPFGPRVSPCSSAAHNRPNTIARAPVPVRAPQPDDGQRSPLRPFWPALASRWPRAPRRQRGEGLVGRAHGRTIGPLTSASLTKRRHGGHRARHSRR